MTIPLRLLTKLSLLEPAYGWSHLPISKPGAMKLFSALRAFPELYQYVAAFSSKTFSRDEGFAGFDSNITIGENGTWTAFGRLTLPLDEAPKIRAMLNQSFRVMLPLEVHRWTRWRQGRGQSVGHPPCTYLPECRSY